MKLLRALSKSGVLGNINLISTLDNLKGLTPAKTSGIGFNLGKDKWVGLIRKAMHNNLDVEDIRLG